MSLETLVRRIEETGLTLKELERIAIHYTVIYPYVEKIEKLVESNPNFFGNNLGGYKLQAVYDYLVGQIAGSKIHTSIQPNEVEHLIEADKRIGEQ